MNTAYVIAVTTSLGCGVNVLCLRAIGADSTGQRPRTYPNPNDCVGALNRLMANAQQEAKHQLDVRYAPQGSTLPYMPPSPQMN
jgi:hypothetical protein